MATFGKAFSDPYYVNVVQKDQANFLHPDAKIIRSMGVLKKFVDGGKAAGGTKDAYEKAEREMRTFKEEWDVRENVASDSVDKPST